MSRTLEYFVGVPSKAATSGREKNKFGSASKRPVNIVDGIISRSKEWRPCSLSPSFSAADANPQISQVTDARDLGVPLDTTFTSSVQRGCEYSKATAFHGPEILQRTIQNSIYLAVLCSSAANHCYNGNSLDSRVIS